MQVVVLLPASLEEIDLGVLVRLFQRKQYNASGFIHLRSPLVGIYVHVTIQVLLSLGSHVPIKEKLSVVANITERLAELVLRLVHVLKYLAQEVVVFVFVSGPKSIIPVAVTINRICLKKVTYGLKPICGGPIIRRVKPISGPIGILGKPLGKGFVMGNGIGLSLVR